MIRFSNANGQVFEEIGTRPYTRKDGQETTLRVWQSTCRVCREPFIFALPMGVTTLEQSTNFGLRTCPAHRNEIPRPKWRTVRRKGRATKARQKALRV